MFIADSHVHGQLIAWADYAEDISGHEQAIFACGSHQSVERNQKQISGLIVSSFRTKVH